VVGRPKTSFGGSREIVDVRARLGSRGKGRSERSNESQRRQEVSKRKKGLPSLSQSDGPGHFQKTVDFEKANTLRYACHRLHLIIAELKLMRKSFNYSLGRSVESGCSAPDRVYQVKVKDARA
jgi:hypothetical protein